MVTSKLKYILENKCPLTINELCPECNCPLIEAYIEHLEERSSCYFKNVNCLLNKLENINNMTEPEYDEVKQQYEDIKNQLKEKICL